jgi:hypothetical protein
MAKPIRTIWIYRGDCVRRIEPGTATPAGWKLGRKAVLKSKEYSRLRQAWRNQRMDAERRGLDFYFDFASWLKFWEDSGHLSERGPFRGQYVMARKGDKGPYRVNNVRIVRVEANHAEAWSRPEQRQNYSIRHKGNKYNLGRKHSDETRKKQSLARKGKPRFDLRGRKLTLETRAKISAAQMGRPGTMKGRFHTMEARRKMSLSRTGKKPSEGSRLKMSEARKRFWERRRNQSQEELRHG